MDLLNRIHSEEFQLGVMVTVVGGLILGGIIFLLGILFASFRKFLKSLPSKIKLLITNVGSWDFSQRVLQNRKQGEHGQALDDYVQSFGGWGSEDTDGITLSITRGGETRTYYGVIGIHVNNNIIAQNAQDITIVHKKQGRDIASPAFIEFVIDEDVEKLAKQCYYQKILGTKELKIRWSSGHWDTTP